MENQRVRQTLGFTQNFAAIGAAIGSMLPVYVATQSGAFNYIGVLWPSVIIGLFAVVLFAAVVEYGMRTYFPYGIRGFLTGQAFAGDWRKSALFTTITLLSFGLMFSSGYMSFEGRKEAGQIAAGKLNTTNIESVAANVSQNENALLRIARSERATKSKEVESRKKDIKQGNSELNRLALSGNTWASNKLQRVIDSDKKLKQLEAELKQKSETIETLLKQASVSKAVETVSAENQLRLETWKERHETTKSIVGWFGIVSIIIFALSSVILELFKIVEESQEPSISKAPILPPSEIVPVSGTSFTIERKVDEALRRTDENKAEIDSLKQNPEPVSPEYSPEISEPETVSTIEPETKKDIPETFEIVSKGNQKAVWVPGFRTEAFSLSQCKSKLQGYEWKLKQGKGKPETNQENISKFKKAIKLLS